MSEKERKIADCIFCATTHLEAAGTVLQVTMEHFRLCEIDLPEKDRQIIGLNTETIGVMLNIVADYISQAVSALDEGSAS